MASQTWTHPIVGIEAESFILKPAMDSLKSSKEEVGENDLFTRTADNIPRVITICESLFARN